MSFTTQKFVRGQAARVSFAPLTTAGDKRAFDMRPKASRDLHYEPRVHFASAEAQPALLDELKE